MFNFLFRLSDRLRDRRRRLIWDPNLATGRRGEDLAHRYLRENGCTIVARNYRARSGMAELDIIARDGETLVFVEVKARSSASYGPPDRAIDRKKRRRLFRGAREYVRRAGADWSHIRFDVVSVLLEDTPSIKHYRNVFPLTTEV